ncbi:GxxExxY protein [Thioalbus denitrificans]|uniref:GxxExxY protein n=1 Tax=Thioalbus denitrificans TaxID=547122 RepID=A0A369CHJ9_9GAMM|nr:GxxExxY protein [Thioalbus denitrificans]RCX33399.1 GxxExxY protein [Thioalbus denitrificans]
MEFDALSRRVIGCALEVHKELGPGLLESAYERCLAYELAQRGLAFAQKQEVAIRYKSLLLDCAYRVDLIVGSSLIVELKSVERLMPIHEAQLLSYMKATSIGTGLLINFNVPLLRQGIRRRVL